MLASSPQLRRISSLVYSERRSSCYRGVVSTHQPRNIHKRLLVTEDTTSSTNKTAAGDDALTVDGKTSTDCNNNTTAKLIQPRPLFPWRSSPYPLPRLVMPTRNNTSPKEDGSDETSQQIISDEEYYDSDYFTKGGPLGPGWFNPMEPWIRGVLFANSMHLLNVSWLSIILPWTRKEWVEEMEWCFCEAFLRGVNGMIYDTYMLDDESDASDRNENTESDESFDLVLDFDHTIRKHKGGTTDDAKRRILDMNEEQCMLQHNLRQLYQSAREHSLPSDVNIVLKTEPVRAEIESIFPIFGLSRSLVQDHPNLRHSYRNLAKLIERKQKEKLLEGKQKLNFFELATIITQGLDDLMETSAKLTEDDGHGLITIIAQVSIHCREVFCVKDVTTGEILQGYADENPRDVTHLVRFEMVVKDSPEEELLLGRWQISDWDDLLDGNVWFT